MSWNDLRVAQEIGLNFGTLIVPSILVGAIAYNGFATVVDPVGKADDANRLIKLAQEVRRHEKNYIIRGDEEARHLVLDSIRRVLEQTENTRGKFESLTNIAQIERVRSETQAYQQSFATWVGLAEQQKTLEQDLVREARIARDGSRYDVLLTLSLLRDGWGISLAGGRVSR